VPIFIGRGAPGLSSFSDATRIASGNGRGNNNQNPGRDEAPAF
jgi:hypothetical protein